MEKKALSKLKVPDNYYVSDLFCHFMKDDLVRIVFQLPTLFGFIFILLKYDIDTRRSEEGE